MKIHPSGLTAQCYPYPEAANRGIRARKVRRASYSGAARRLAGTYVTVYSSRAPV